MSQTSKLVKLLLALLLTVPGLAAGKSVDFTWTEPDLGVFPVCSGTVTVNCVAGFNLYDTTGGGARVRLNTVPVPVPAGATAATVIGTTVTGFTQLGASTVVAVAVYNDRNGVPAESLDSLPVTFRVAVGPPLAPAALPR